MLEYYFSIILLLLSLPSFSQIHRHVNTYPHQVHNHNVYAHNGPTYVHHGPTYVNRGPTFIHHGPVVVHSGPVVVHHGPVVVHPVYMGAPMWGPYWHPVGFTVATIAATAIIVHAIDENNQKEDFYCDKGVYYEKTSDGKYKVVAAPIGSTLKDLPKGYVTLIVKSNTYYYYAGNYYQDNKGGYVVITAPKGAVVNALPEGTKTEIVDGSTYYVCNGIWYQAVATSNGKQNYTVVPPSKS